MKWKPDTKVKVFGKSIHSGQEGIIVADHGPYIMILANDPTYIHAHKNTIEPKGSDRRFFWVDTLCLKEIK